MEDTKNESFPLENFDQALRNKENNNVKEDNLQSNIFKPIPRRIHHFNHKKLDEKCQEEISVVLSIIYGLIIVILAVVFKVTESVTDKAQLISKEYQCVLFAIAIAWLIGFKIYDVWHENKTSIPEVIRSPHSTNRWLKGVVALFGFAIIIKDSLEVIGVAEIDNPKCEKQPIYFFNFILHSLFIVGQVILLFFYARVYIQKITFISRFGLMHIMATNLAVWIAVIAEETNHALHLESAISHSNEHSFQPDLNFDSNFDALKKGIVTNCNNSSTLLEYISNSGYNDTTEYSYNKQGAIFSGKCSCNTTVCYVIGRAEKFLTPLLVEYCLVSSCLIYVMWSHVGTKPKHHCPVPKPSHKFYKSYKGVMLGAIMLVATVIILTLLGTLDSGTESILKSYYTEYPYLTLYDIFLLTFNITILLACIAGFYVFSVAKLKRSESAVNLDIVLLFICITGPLLVQFFSTLGLCAGMENTKAPGWTVSLISSLTDMAVTIIQVLFAVHGLNKEPGTQEQYPEKHVNDNYKNLHHFYDNHSMEGQSHHQQQLNVIKLPESTTENGERIEPNLTNIETIDSSTQSRPASAVKEASLPDPPACTQYESPPGTKLSWSDYNLGRKDQVHLRPRRVRIILREIMIFLVMCNTCLYIFLSLNLTVYRVYPYANEYFGHSTWTTLSSVSAPLSIFLKLHLAACFFEIWSYS